MISQKAKYALRALLALARAGESGVVRSQIAAGQRMPRKFLEQIRLHMKRSGPVRSRRGRLGGSNLLKPAEGITFGEVLRLIDGPIAPLPCLSRIAYRRCEDCTEEATCEIRKVFVPVAQSAREVLDRNTIADALARSDPPPGLADRALRGGRSVSVFLDKTITYSIGPKIGIDFRPSTMRQFKG
ncbi:Rrf2 family transcriptional regulator [Jiella sp. CQZ9-1]|uniref:Rrf2 family transcriptional regulator n=1 Tax=Jiella flava TaxID=2816857 RepID=A0A939FWU3_9HYPH|nr:Rrf2 family transcriptional regulator [Jiella flava]